MCIQIRKHSFLIAGSIGISVLVGALLNSFAAVSDSAKKIVEISDSIGKDETINIPNWLDLKLGDFVAEGEVDQEKGCLFSEFGVQIPAKPGSYRFIFIVPDLAMCKLKVSSIGEVPIERMSQEQPVILPAFLRDSAAALLMNWGHPSENTALTVRSPYPVMAVSSLRNRLNLLNATGCNPGSGYVWGDAYAYTDWKIAWTEAGLYYDFDCSHVTDVNESSSEWNVGADEDPWFVTYDDQDLDYNSSQAWHGAYGDFSDGSGYGSLSVELTGDPTGWNTCTPWWSGFSAGYGGGCFGHHNR